MKKIIALILALVMVCSLAACGASKSKTENLKERTPSFANKTQSKGLVSKAAEAKAEKAEQIKKSFVPSPGHTPREPMYIEALINGNIESVEVLTHSNKEYSMKTFASGWEYTDGGNVEIWTNTENDNLRYFISSEFAGYAKDEVISNFVDDRNFEFFDRTDGEDMMIGTTEDATMHFFCTESGRVIACVYPTELAAAWGDILPAIISSFEER